MRRFVLLGLLLLFLSACYPAGDCDVEWQVAEGATWGTVVWDCDVELPDGD